MPYVIKNEFGGTAGDFGLVLAVAGLGSATGSFFMGRRDLPRRPGRHDVPLLGLRGAAAGALRGRHGDAGT